MRNPPPYADLGATGRLLQVRRLELQVVKTPVIFLSPITIPKNFASAS